MQTHEIKHPWYREPWVWLLIALPMTAVVGGMITIYIAVTTSDGLVEDDYYKRGMAINRDLARDRAAADHRLQAHLDVDLNYRRVVLTLRSQDYDLPDTVSLAFLHPTQAGHDQTVVLQKVDVDRYSGAVSGLLHGNWYVQLSADDWRLSGALQLPQVATVVVLPAYTPDP